MMIIEIIISNIKIYRKCIQCLFLVLHYSSSGINSTPGVGEHSVRDPYIWILNNKCRVVVFLCAVFWLRTWGFDFVSCTMGDEVRSVRSIITEGTCRLRRGRV